ncbi:MAG: ATP-binding cassette domain-containing protein [Acetatifactor sp.]|nr:ATP-binding cassette domain-containing protein [Acetatifactor sp.]
MIELRNVTYKYEDHPVFQGISFRVEKGQKVGIVGESGCGKSTLLKLIAGLYTPASGEIIVAGKSAAAEITKKVTVVMQSPMLLPMSIRENITMGHDYPEEWIDMVIDAANIRSWIDTLDKGLDTYLGDRADELSGGQAQRIAIARAICKNAEILLLDEPTSALDGENAACVLEALNRYAADKTVIHVTHRPEHLSGYDRIFSMKAGKLSDETAGVIIYES